MSTMQHTVHPAPSVDERLRTLGRTVRWAPAPRWGSTPAEHARYAVYLGGSILGWIVAGLAIAALVGTALGLLG